MEVVNNGFLFLCREHIIGLNMLKRNMCGIKRNMSTSPHRAYGRQPVLVSLSKLSYQIKSEGTDNEKRDFKEVKNIIDNQIIPRSGINENIIEDIKEYRKMLSNIFGDILIIE